MANRHTISQIYIRHIKRVRLPLSSGGAIHGLAPPQFCVMYTTFGHKWLHCSGHYRAVMAKCNLTSVIVLRPLVKSEMDCIDRYRAVALFKANHRPISVRALYTTFCHKRVGLHRPYWAVAPFIANRQTISVIYIQHDKRVRLPLSGGGAIHGLA